MPDRLDLPAGVAVVHVANLRRPAVGRELRHLRLDLVAGWVEHEAGVVVVPEAVAGEREVDPRRDQGPLVAERTGGARRRLLVPLLLTVALAAGLVVRLGNPELHIDEITYMSRVLESMGQGSLFMVQGNGEAFMNKPPFAFWTMRAAFEILGVSPHNQGNFDDGAKVQEVINAVEQSHRERRWVDLPLDRTAPLTARR